MKLTINGQPHEFQSETMQLSELLDNLGLGEKPVVIELNQEALLPGSYTTTEIEEGAELEIVTIAAGG